MYVECNEKIQNDVVVYVVYVLIIRKVSIFTFSILLSCTVPYTLNDEHCRCHKMMDQREETNKQRTIYNRLLAIAIILAIEPSAVKL